MKQPSSHAGHVFRAWLVANGLTIPTFSEKFGFHRITIQRVITGEGRKRISLALALRIQRATDGGVPLSVWESDESEDAPSSGSHRVSDIAEFAKASND